MNRKSRSGGGFPLRLAAVVVLGGAVIVGTTALAPAPPRRHVVEIRGMEFRPAVVELTRGDTVIWVNRDIVPHTATADAKASWDTGMLPIGQSGQTVPRRAGEVSYHCTLHPTMRGRLIVR